MQRGFIFWYMFSFFHRDFLDRASLTVHIEWNSDNEIQFAKMEC